MKTITIPVQEGIPGQLATFPTLFQVVPGSSQLSQTALAADTLFVPDQLLSVPTRRLIVLVPSGEIDELTLTRRVWLLATCSGLDILYLALSPDADQVSYQRRRLVGLVALTAYQHVRADMDVYAEKYWSQLLRRTLQPGDLLVCLACDRTPGFFHRQALGELLATELGVPVYQVGGLQVKSATPSHYWFKNVLACIASIALVVVFFQLQIGIEVLSARPQSTILLCLSVLLELYGLWKINEWIG